MYLLGGSRSPLWRTFRKRFPARKWSHYQSKGEYLTVGWQKRWTLPSERIGTRPDLRSKPRTAKTSWRIHWGTFWHRETPVKQSRASQKHALHPAFIGTLFFPSTSDELNVPRESYGRFQQIPTSRHSGKTNVSRLLIRRSLLTTLCIALYLLTASHATVSDQNVYKVQITARISATQEQAFDIRSAASVPVQVCPTNPKEPYKIGQANDESQTTMRKPPQPVTQRLTTPFPPMTSSDADFPARPVYEVPRSSRTLKREFLSQGRSHVNPLHSDMSPVERER